MINSNTWLTNPKSKSNFKATYIQAMLSIFQNVSDGGKHLDRIPETEKVRFLTRFLNV